MLLCENDDSITARKFPRVDLGTLILVVEMCNCWLGVLEVVSKESDHAILLLDQGLSGIGGDVKGVGERRGEAGPERSEIFNFLGSEESQTVSASEDLRFFGP
jgi:hypothetical protein